MLPVIWWVRYVARQPFSMLGFTAKHVRESVIVGLGFGFLFLLAGYIGNLIRPAGDQFTSIAAVYQYSMLGVLILSVATAFSEEVLNRGFLFHLVATKTKQFIKPLVVASILSVLLRVPILVTSLKFGGLPLVIFFSTELALGFINNFLVYKYKSIVSVVLIHLFWNITAFYYL